MPNNTDTYWEADNQSLHTYARSIETLGGMGPPDFRGEDVTIPLQPGETWVPKVHGSNIITLAMWLRGVAQDAGAGITKETKAQYQSNWNDLIRLLWTPGRQVALRKRFYDGGILRQATAMAEYAGSLQPTMMGNSAAKCAIDMKIAKGVFYNDVEITQPIVNGNNSIVVLGNAPTNRIEITINGSRTNAKIRNATAGVEFTYARQLLSGANVVIDVDKYRAIDSNFGTTDMGPHIIHTGSPQWLVLLPGANNIVVSSTAGIGTITLKYRAAWV